MKSFSLKYSDGKARTGSYSTASGEFETPNFMPVGTQGSVKAVDVERLKELGMQIQLVNTYHLMLRPGSSMVRKLGGIHKFTGFDGPILSDSGGFQVFSLRGIRKISEEGVEFRSHVDGSKHFLSPESSIEIQEELGVDIAMVLDECPSGDVGYDEMARSLSMTNRWALRSLNARKKDTTAIFGITQGGTHKDLRTTAAEALSGMPFDGMAIGGLSVGEPKEGMYEVLSYHPSQLPKDKLRYLMGVGTPEDIVQAVYDGVDLFDCVMPTRSGRFGRAFIWGDEPYLNLRNAKFESSSEPLDRHCRCIACRNYSRGYIHHLFRVREMLGPQLLSIHNLSHYLGLMKSIREAIREARFEILYKTVKDAWRAVSLGGASLLKEV